MKNIRKISWHTGACIGLASLLGCSVGHDPDTHLSDAQLDRIEDQLDAMEPVDVPVQEAPAGSTAGRPAVTVPEIPARRASVQPSSTSYEDVTRPEPPATTSYQARTFIGQPTTQPVARPDRTVTAQTVAKQTTNYDVYYALRPNETVWDVANAYQIPDDVLLSANRLTYDQAKRLPPGTTLFVPGAEPQTTTVVTTTETRNAPTAAVATSGPQPQPYRTQIAVLKHRVSGGETLSSLARLYNVPVGDIVRQNAIEGPVTAPLQPGTVLEIPSTMNHTQTAAAPSPQAVPAPPPATGPAFEHILAKGETLSDLAERYDVSVEAIMARNGLRVGEVRHLYAGDPLLIPQPRAYRF